MCKSKLTVHHEGKLSTKKCLPVIKKGIILYMEIEYELQQS